MRFLSEEWFWEAHVRLAADEAFRNQARGTRMRLWIVPESAPQWARPITVIVDVDTVDLDEGTTGTPDAAGYAAYATWLAILRHELHPRRAVVTRKLRGRGIPAMLSHWKTIDLALDVLRTVDVEE